MSMKSLDEMRNELQICKTCNARPTIAAMSSHADAIERELDEHYVELPMDADGVPIGVDDLIKLPNGKITAVRFITFNDAGWLINESGWFPERVTHYQPDTWERIIEDAIHAGATDVNNDVRGNLVDRCRALAGDDE